MLRIAISGFGRIGRTFQRSYFERYNELKEKIETAVFTIKHKVGANGHLIGSVTNKEIASELAKFDINIDKKPRSKVKPSDHTPIELIIN